MRRLLILSLLVLAAISLSAQGQIKRGGGTSTTTTTPSKPKATPAKPKTNTPKATPAKPKTTLKRTQSKTKTDIPESQDMDKEPAIGSPDVPGSEEPEPIIETFSEPAIKPTLEPAPSQELLDPVIQNLINNMVYVEGGTFTMGATSEQGSKVESNEKPAHQVTLSSFSIGRYEVTQEEWRAVMGNNPSFFKGSGTTQLGAVLAEKIGTEFINAEDKRPVERVSWDDCQEFIRKLNAFTGKNFRLPTEAEWEYAARGGNRSQGYKYAGSDNLGSVAWYNGNSDKETHPVGQKSPNELGLYDMSGNVCEWCADRYGSYSSSLQTNPKGASTGSNYVCRGGDWDNSAKDCRISYRSSIPNFSRVLDLGLRLALDL